MPVVLVSSIQRLLVSGLTSFGVRVRCANRMGGKPFGESPSQLVHCALSHHVCSLLQKQWINPFAFPGNQTKSFAFTHKMPVVGSAGVNGWNLYNPVSQSICNDALAVDFVDVD